MADNRYLEFRKTVISPHTHNEILHSLRATVLYTDVDGQCDKLVTETVTSLPR